MFMQPEGDDPFQLNAIGIPDPSGASLREMSRCFAEEFLRMGFPPGRVLALFESPAYVLPHEALRVLGHAEIRALIESLARTWHRPARTG